MLTGFDIATSSQCSTSNASSIIYREFGLAGDKESERGQHQPSAPFRGRFASSSTWAISPTPSATPTPTNELSRASIYPSLSAAADQVYDDVLENLTKQGDRVARDHEDRIKCIAHHTNSSIVGIPRS